MWEVKIPQYGLKVAPDQTLREMVATLLQQNAALFSELTRLRGDLERSGAIKALPHDRPMIAPPLPSIDVSPGHRKRSHVT